MIIDFTTLSPNHRYFVTTQALIPRPIAWVLSENENGKFNLAPFSYFNAVTSDPAVMMVSVGNKADGAHKDTRRNIEERNHFVIHIPSVQHIDSVNESSRALPYGESELDGLECETVDFPGFSLPRVAGCPIAFGCKRFDILEIGNNKQSMILGEVERVFLDDSVASEDERGRVTINPIAVDPLGRLGGKSYAGLGKVVERERPR